MTMHATPPRDLKHGSPETASGTRRTFLGLLSGITAVAAWYGSGYLAFGDALDGLGVDPPSILPGDDWLFGGIALALVVAVPMTATAVLLALGRSIGVDAAVAAGALLMVWLLIQVALIGLDTWLQPVYFVLGLLVFVVGLIELRHQGRA